MNRRCCERFKVTYLEGGGGGGSRAYLPIAPPSTLHALFVGNEKLHRLSCDFSQIDLHCFRQFPSTIVATAATVGTAKITLTAQLQVMAE